MICICGGFIRRLTCSRCRTLSSVWAALRLRHCVHPRSNSRRERGWNSSWSKSLSAENSSCLIRSRAVICRKEPNYYIIQISSHVYGSKCSYCQNSKWLTWWISMWKGEAGTDKHIETIIPWLGIFYLLLYLNKINSIYIREFHKM